MFTQKSIDSKSITELTALIKSMAREVSDRINDPEDALDYVNSLMLLSESLRERIEYVLED
jgi:hypothetical protein